MDSILLLVGFTLCLIVICDDLAIEKLREVDGRQQTEIDWLKVLVEARRQECEHLAKEITKIKCNSGNPDPMTAMLKVDLERLELKVRELEKK